MENAPGPGRKLNTLQSKIWFQNTRIELRSPPAIPLKANEELFSCVTAPNSHTHHFTPFLFNPYLFSSSKRLSHFFLSFFLCLSCKMIWNTPKKQPGTLLFCLYPNTSLKRRHLFQMVSFGSTSTTKCYNFLDILLCHLAQSVHGTTSAHSACKVGISDVLCACDLIPARHVASKNMSHLESGRTSKLWSCGLQSKKKKKKKDIKIHVRYKREPPRKRQILKYSLDGSSTCVAASEVQTKNIANSQASRLGRICLMAAWDSWRCSY